MPPRTTIPTLQSLRGVAALVVLLHHASFVFATRPGFRGALEAVFNAHAAVAVFFVLSGFVLSRSLGAAPLSAGAVLRFWWRRGFRIYPAAWAGCALAVVVLALFAGVPTPGASRWFATMLAPARLDGAAILQDFAMLKVTLVPPLWSVRVELAMALVMPALWWLVRRGWALALIVGTGSLCLALGSAHALFAYAFAFALGSSLARHDDLSIPPAAALAALVALLCFRRIDPAWHFETGFNAVVPTFVESLAGAVVVGFLAQGGGPRWLVAAPLVALGDVSYSLYVLHFPILVALSKLPVFTAMAPEPAALLLMVLTLAATLPLALLSWRWIEQPGIAIGRKWQRHAG